MGNMSYCAAENTNNDVLDLIELIENGEKNDVFDEYEGSDYEADAIRCLLYTSPSPRDKRQSRMPSSA